VTPTTATATVGDSVQFTVVMKSTEKNIITLDISQEIGNGAVSNLPAFPYTSVSSVTQNYWYHIPTAAQSGNLISLVFKVVNSNAISNSALATVTVK